MPYPCPTCKAERGTHDATCPACGWVKKPSPEIPAPGLYYAWLLPLLAWGVLALLNYLVKPFTQPQWSDETERYEQTMGNWFFAFVPSIVFVCCHIAAVSFIIRAFQARRRTHAIAGTLVTGLSLAGYVTLVLCLLAIVKAAHLRAMGG